MKAIITATVASAIIFVFLFFLGVVTAEASQVSECREFVRYANARGGWDFVRSEGLQERALRCRSIL